jgi:hypothetical protein
MESTLTTFKIPNQIKNDFHTICQLKQSSMTGEIVRLVTNYISQESNKFKTYQLTSQELNELKQKKLSKPMSHPSINRLRRTRWEDSF